MASSVLDIGFAVYASEKTNVASLFSRVGSNFDHIHFDLVDRTICPDAAPVDLSVIPKAKHLWAGKPSMLHLMSRDPLLWLHESLSLVDAVVLHEEPECALEEVLQFCKERGKKVGIGLHNTMISTIGHGLLELLDFVLILCVEKPGYSGQIMRSGTIDRVNQIAKLRGRYRFSLIVDGGVTAVPAPSFDADSLVCASALLGSSNPANTYKILRTRALPF
jgi:ribulose-phosphate 3-epimerase